MSELKAIFDEFDDDKDYGEGARILDALLESLKRKRKIAASDLAEIANFTFGEIDKLIEALPNINSYKAKSDMIEYLRKVFGFFLLLYKRKFEMSESQYESVDSLVKIFKEEQALNNAVDAVFEDDKCADSDVEKALEIAAASTDEYEKSELYDGLLNYKAEIDKLSDAAKTKISAYIASELKRYLSIVPLTDDMKYALELIADVSKYFYSEEIGELLKKVMSLNINDINIYALQTLLMRGENVPEDVILNLAKDDDFAEHTYSIMSRLNAADLFPKEYTDSEYLAQSDMIHWLTYPTELDGKPNAIELIGTVKVKKLEYYVYKFRSDSDNLDDELKNVWLVGWSSRYGMTFSNFEPLNCFEKESVEKTLKAIRKSIKRTVSKQKYL